jgi:hypothetical protein
MAIIACKECHQTVSLKAKSCPHCGAKVRTKIGRWRWVAGIILLLAVISRGMGTSNTAPQNTPSNSASPVASTSHSEGDTVHVGYTSYAVWRSRWTDRLSQNEFINQRPDAHFWLVDLSVRNNDKHARSIPPFYLVDEHGAEYERSNKGWAVEDSLGILDSLNPSVTKQGLIVFDVPKEHSYKLKVSGGYWSGEDTYIMLSPK